MELPSGSTPTFDFIVVGAGTAGSVLASRLSSDPGTRVLLLEAGADQPPGEEHASIRDPYPASLGDPTFSWPDLTAEVGADRGDGQPRFSRQFLQGFGMGGSSNIQGMVALRGVPQDYEEWRNAGAIGWGWQDVLPYFRLLENDLDFVGPLHGQGGPIPIRRVPPNEWAPFASAFARSALRRGYPMVQDFNAEFGPGVGPLPMANLLNQRVSASMGYLDAAVRRRSNLSIVTDTHVERVEFYGRKAVGVWARTLAGRRLLRGGEIILCAGAVHSPAILMRSGVGPAEHLNQWGIELVRDLSGVGQHLMNHVGVGIAAYLPAHAVQSGAQRGFGQSCLQFSTGLEGPENDILLVAVNKGGWHPLGRRIGALAVEVHKTHSLGEVRLRSPNPMVTAEVKFNLLSDWRDLARLLVGLKVLLEIFCDAGVVQVTDDLFIPNGKVVRTLGKRSLRNWLRASIAALLCDVEPLRRRLIGPSKVSPQLLLRDPGALKQWAMQYAAPPHHVSCTCRMGRIDDTGAVVDSECRVRGVENLRVVDASIMPTLVRANTHIPVIMIAEKMADHLRANPH